MSTQGAIRLAPRVMRRNRERKQERGKTEKENERWVEKGENVFHSLTFFRHWKKNYEKRRRIFLKKEEEEEKMKEKLHDKLRTRPDSSYKLNGLQIFLAHEERWVQENTKVFKLLNKSNTR